MSTFDERSEALDNIDRLGQGIGYSMAQQDLAEIMTNMNEVDFNVMKSISFAMETKFKQRFPNFGIE